ncbi:SMP-30/gluconolactonase/LRE family protein [Pannus brasiliensis CCIBt3594]|uniref:SMP-30/gluconolactonase/LRE family protein n=1 Tax=Pannus brasiliensis CCIBt3594 TaxID=1427578 RepID=A0AAW9QTE8_9CHRO
MNILLRSKIQIQQVQAIDLVVNNVDLSKNFYVQALGFEVISDTVIENNRIRSITLKLGDESVRLQQYLDIPGKPVPVDSRSNDRWFQHLAIVVSDMERAYHHLRAFPIEFISTEPQTIPIDNPEAAGIQAFKFRDLDRHPLELIWFPSDKGQKKWHEKSDRLFLGIDHTAITVADTEESLEFYRDFLGMRVDGGSLNHGETQARMDGLPIARVRITALRPPRGGMGIELLDYLEPAGGRPIPSDWQDSDMTSTRVEFASDEIDRDYSIQDPTGHSLLLIPEDSMTGSIEIYDDRMHPLIRSNASLQKLTGGAVHTEGPVYFPEDDSIVYSDAHGNRLLRWSRENGVTVLRDPSDYQNGNYRDLEGRLVGCSGGLRAIVRREHDGEWKVLIDRFQGKRLNSPNDLVVKSDGTIWFTDPPYGITEPNQGYGGIQEQPGSYVYRFDPKTSEIDVVITDMLRPNGLAFSPDENLLYVSDSSAYNIPDGFHHVRVYEVIDDRKAINGRVFAVIDPGQPDGLRVDKRGNVFISSEDSVQIYAPDGTRIGKIPVPETVANLTFAGNRLIIAAGGSLYSIDLR